MASGSLPTGIEATTVLVSPLISVTALAPVT
jgi:hypothetical protein